MVVNKYNVRALRSELDACIRHQTWNKYRSILETSSLSQDTLLYNTVILARSKRNHGTLLHSIVNSVRGDHPSFEKIMDIIQGVVEAAPKALTIQDSSSQTPLHIAVERNASKELVELLVTKDASRISLSMGDKHGMLPLHRAAKEEASDVMEILVRYDTKHMTLLVPEKRRNRIALYFVASNELRFMGSSSSADHQVLPFDLERMLVHTRYAIEKCEYDNVSTLVQHSRLSENNLRFGPNDQERPRHLLISLLVCADKIGEKFTTKILNFLLQSPRYRPLILGDSIDQQGNSFLHCMYLVPGLRLEASLLKTVLSEYDPSSLTRGNANGDTPLHVALLNESIYWNCILDIGYDSLLCRNTRGQLPLHVALSTGQLEIARDLWNKCPSTASMMDPSTRLYPYQLAACCKRDDVISSSSGYSEDELDCRWLWLIFDLLLASPQSVDNQQWSRSTR